MAETAKKTWSSIGFQVTVGGYRIKAVTGVTGLSSAPSMLDATTMDDEMERQEPGVQGAANTVITFHHDDSEGGDTLSLEAIEAAKEEVVIEFRYPSGAVYETTGKVSVQYGDVAVNGILTDTLTIARTSKLRRKAAA